MTAPSVSQVLGKLKGLYTPPKSFLHHRNPFELLVATIMSAQCTDARVNIITKDLFTKYRGPKDFLKVPIEELERDIHSCGHYHAKAGYIQKSSRIILEKFGGEVPSTREELESLPGVGRKTAACILYAAFGKLEGIAVDTHVLRLSQRLGLTKARDPKKIELDLMKKTPRKDWGVINPLLIMHGRAVCTALNRKCDQCVFQATCPSSWTRGKKDLARE